MAEFIEFKSKDCLEAEKSLDELISFFGLKENKSEIGLAIRPEFDKEKTDAIDACSFIIDELIKNPNNKTSGKLKVKFVEGSATNVYVEVLLKSLHVENVSEFCSAFLKSDNIEFIPLTRKGIFQFNAKFNNAATPVPVGKDGDVNE